VVKDAFRHAMGMAVRGWAVRASSVEATRRWKEAFADLLRSAGAPEPKEGRAKGDAKRALVAAAQAQPKDALLRFDRDAIRLAARTVCESHGERKAVNAALRLRSYASGDEHDVLCICSQCATSERFPPPDRVAQGQASLSDVSRVLLSLALEGVDGRDADELEACVQVALVLAQLQAEEGASAVRRGEGA